MAFTAVSGSTPVSANGRRTPYARPTAFSVALSKLSSQLSPEYLAVLLELPLHTVKDILGARHTALSQYEPHVLAKLRSMGINLFGSKELTVTQDLRKKLDEALLKSKDTSLLRTLNFRKLVDNVPVLVLADALELSPGAVDSIASGDFSLDDQRMGHINPRLMAAGFPDGWLELPSGTVSDAHIAGLTRLANEEPEADEGEPHSTEVVMSTRSQKANGSKKLADSKKVVVARIPIMPSAPVTKGKPISVHQLLKAKKQSKAAPQEPQEPRAAVASETAPAAVKKSSKIIAKASEKSKKKTAAEAPPKRNEAVAPTSSAPGNVPALAMKARKRPVGRPLPAISKGNQMAEPILTVELHEARVTALTRLLELGPYGAASRLWVKTLGRSSAYWPGIRARRTMFSNALAREVEAVLQLPEGWLDNASFPPSTIVPWMLGTAPSKATQKVAPTNLGLMAGIPASNPATTPPATIGFSSNIEARTTTASLGPVAIVAAPSQAAPAYEANPTQDATNLQLPESAHLTKALVAILAERSRSGEFTEQHALELINKLTT